MWIDHAIWWHVYPLGFVGAPIRDVAQPDDREVVHRLSQLENWLDYAIELGTNGLALGPVFSSSSHGYDTVDHFAIDRRLGDGDDFDRLVNAAKSRGMRVVLDGVFNHVGRDHPWFQSVLSDGRRSEFADCFHVEWRGNDLQHARYFEGHDSLVELNHNAPRVRHLVEEVMLHWLRRGIDGWRLDAAYAVDPTFWREALGRVRAEFPDAWIFGEVLHGDYVAYVETSGLDSVTQYELWKAIWSSLSDRNFFELSWALQRHNSFVEHFLPMTFVGNHDVTRLASVVGEAHIVPALAILCTVGGIPTVYYGDEQGYQGIKRDHVAGDDEVRPSFPSTPETLSTLGRWVFEAHQALLSIRRRHAWLVNAQIAIQSLTNERIAYQAHGERSDQQLSVVLDLTGDPSVVIATKDETLYSS